MIFYLDLEDEENGEPTECLVSECYVKDYGTGWFGIKRTDFENGDKTHAIPEGTVYEWKDLFRSFQNCEEYSSTRLALKYSGDFVILYSPRNAGCMRGNPNRDYLALDVETFQKFIQEIIQGATS